MYHVMIVEDDKKIASLIQSHVERYGYKAYIVEDYSNIKSEFIKHNPHIVLMDINLPFYDGFYWCRDIRTISKAPIIFISARSSDMDQVMAIENGGDDYITKPFSYDVLIAKIKSALRRVYGEYSENNNSEVYEVKGLYLNINQNTLEFNEIKIELSKKEFLLIHSLLKKPNTIISRDELLEILWDDVDFVDDNTLSVNITRVRKRLEELGIRNAIETKRGQGYSITVNWDI
ncbi:response regulator transcription factor [Alkaliphilus sp. B6464]|nr:response regulator transcription factor [Alkaliphilus sp. B6464]QUH18882.1 response regulator transcription factor [Alkaliphilus sp. B6464]